LLRGAARARRTYHHWRAGACVLTAYHLLDARAGGYWEP